MADIADWIIQQGLDASVGSVEPPLSQVICRYCGESDLHWVETDYGWRVAQSDGTIHSCDASRNKCCKYCGQDNLHWTKTDKGWRLADSDNIVHSCDAGGGQSVRKVGVMGRKLNV